MTRDLAAPPLWPSLARSSGRYLEFLRADTER